MFTIVANYGGSMLHYVCSTMQELHLLVFWMEKDSEVYGYQVMKSNEFFDLSSQMWKIKKYKPIDIYENKES